VLDGILPGELTPQEQRGLPHTPQRGTHVDVQLSAEQRGDGVLAARLQPLPALEAESQDGGTVPESAPATRPAEEPLSLGSVFGEDPPAVAPAVPPAGASPAETAGDAGAPAVSFDEFFAGSPVATPGPAPVPRQSRPKSDDDLDQFHSWLQSLKR